MGGDQLVIHVARVAGGVAQPGDAGDFGEARKQPAEPELASVRSLAPPRIDVLPEQGDLAHAGIGQRLRLVDDLLERARHFRAPGIGDNTEGAELVATLLHGEEGGDRS